MTFGPSMLGRQSEVETRWPFWLPHLHTARAKEAQIEKFNQELTKSGVSNGGPGGGDAALAATTETQRSL